jgi:hypothetical protein
LFERASRKAFWRQARLPLVVRQATETLREILGEVLVEVSGKIEHVVAAKEAEGGAWSGKGREVPESLCERVVDDSFGECSVEPLKVT